MARAEAMRVRLDGEIVYRCVLAALSMARLCVRRGARASTGRLLESDAAIVGLVRMCCQRARASRRKVMQEKRSRFRKFRSRTRLPEFIAKSSSKKQASC